MVTIKTELIDVARARAKEREMGIDIHTNRQPNKQEGRQTDKQTNTQASV